ncbi:MAG: ABC transporter permease [Bacteroidetes bacterium]|nr:MAG: ABC transporter permease [Bacteroidota bacterium]
MTVNFLKLSFRNLLRRKFSSLVNILGLAIGFTGFIAISLYVLEERSYDRYHPGRDNIYRIVHNTFNKDRKVLMLPVLFHEHLDGIPEIERTVRFLSFSMGGTFRAGDVELLERKVIYTDVGFFDMFGFELAQGSLETFNEIPNSIILTPDAARRYFGDENPVGKLINYSNFQDLTVAGVLREFPFNSHLEFEMIGNFEGMRSMNNHMFTDWGNHSTVFYFELRNDADPLLTGQKIFDLYDEVRGSQLREKGHVMYLQPLSEVYLQSAGIESSGYMLTGNATTLYIYSISALLIIILACVNYINLTTARATARAREVGMRKVLGAGRGELLKQFLGESLLLCLLAFALSLGLLELFLPWFSDIIGTTLTMNYAGMGLFWPGLLTLVVVVALLSGFYPGVVMSGFRPLDVLKGSTALISRKVQSGLNLNLRYRQVLIVAQIAISVGLVLASTLIVRQNHFAMQSPGFDKENLIVVHLPQSHDINQNFHRLKNRLETYPFIVSTSGGAHVPTESAGNLGRLRLTDQGPEDVQQIYFCPVDFGYFETLGARILQGREFDVSYSTDSVNHVILNQSAVRSLGLTDPVGQVVRGFWDVADKQVIGVVEDINFESVHNTVQPTAYFMNYKFSYYGPATMKMLVRFKHNNLSQVVEAIEESWEESISGYAPSYYFMNQRYNSLYENELQTAGMGRLFSYFAIILAVLGLWGTTAYVLNAKRKEFGIRKVLGASSLRLARMISLEFSIMVFIASLIAWPIVYYFIDNWLDNFVYRIQVPFLPFLLVGVLAWVLCMIIVNTIALSEARRNPIETLKYE